ncbi:S1 family peptidase, partial [Candidatus Protofrankia californiensis]|uniref:S1 family peptidase n=1 Tax=Candidatus Protofrankia californiensis TaxID=1839754 RepID=UPI0010410B0A
MGQRADRRGSGTGNAADRGRHLGGRTVGAGVPADRVVQVHAALCGSGVLVTDRLVLTAAHVVEDASYISVQLPGSQRWREATPVWSAPAPVDVALVKICESGWVPPALPPVRWGWLTGQAGGVPCETQGFPRSTGVCEHATGHVNPGVDEEARYYDMVIREFPAEPPRADEPSRWSGMSGAGLFAGGLLIGVVIRSLPNFGERRLQATQVHVLATDPGFRKLVMAGDGRLPVESVELAGLFTTPVTEWVPSPALLLHPARAVVGFYGRTEERRALADWCADPAAPKI